MGKTQGEGRNGEKKKGAFKGDGLDPGLKWDEALKIEKAYTKGGAWQTID